MANTQVAKRGGGSNIDTVRDLMARSQEKWAALLPKQMSPERLQKVALMAISRNKALLDCSPQSLLEAFIDASTLGLDVCGSMGRAYLVPYKNNKTGQSEAKFIIGYRGLIDLARRSGEIESIAAHVVYEHDEFVVELGDSERIIHKPYMAGDRGKPVAVYAVAKLKGGAVQTDVMTKADVDKIRGRSRASNSGPWVTDYDEMARKTVVRRLCKYLPLTIEAAVAISESDAAEYQDFEVVSSSAPTRTEAQAARVTDAIKGAKKPNKQAAVDAEPEPEGPQPMPDETGERPPDDDDPLFDGAAAYAKGYDASENPYDKAANPKLHAKWLSDYEAEAEAGA